MCFRAWPFCLTTNEHEFSRMEKGGTADPPTSILPTFVRQLPDYGVAGGATGDPDCADLLSTNGQLLFLSNRYNPA